MKPTLSRPPPFARPCSHSSPPSPVLSRSPSLWLGTPLKKKKQSPKNHLQTPKNHYLCP